MKLSKREKILLSLLIASIIIFGVYKFVYSPIVQRITALKEELIEFESKEKTVNELLLKESEIKEQLAFIKEKMKDNSNIYYEIKQEYIIVLLENLLNKSNVKDYVISFTTPEDVILNETKITENNLLDINNLLDEVSTKINIIKGNSINNNDNTENDKEINYQRMLVTIEYECTYNSLISFINSIEKNEEKILINSIDIRKSDVILSGEITLEINAISF